MPDYFNDNFPSIRAWLFLFKKNEELKKKKNLVTLEMWVFSSAPTDFSWQFLMKCKHLIPMFSVRIKYEYDIKAFHSDAVKLILSLIAVESARFHWFAMLCSHFFFKVYVLGVCNLKILLNIFATTRNTVFLAVTQI